MKTYAAITMLGDANGQRENSLVFLSISPSAEAPAAMAERPFIVAGWYLFNSPTYWLMSWVIYL